MSPITLPDRAGATVPAEPDELYVGYLPQAPPRTARFVRRVVPALAVAAVALAGLLASLQGSFDDGEFEYGRTRAIEGTLLEQPYPVLAGGREVGTLDPEAGAAVTGERGALLVRLGKHGAAADAAGLDGRRVRLEATRIESPLGSMLELVPGSLEAVDGTVSPPAPPWTGEELGRVEVSGEVVDSKCFLGVMKPGKGKPHRSCAARCLSGGIPPQLLVEAAGGTRRLLLLAGASGAPLAPTDFLELVGEPVTATGVVERRAGILVLRIDDGALRRAGADR